MTASTIFPTKLVPAPAPVQEINLAEMVQVEGGLATESYLGPPILDGSPPPHYLGPPVRYGSGVV